MRLRPLPIALAPHPDELLSGWLARLAAANHCAFAELLAHLDIDSRHAGRMDFDLGAGAADRIAAATRMSPALVHSLTFPASTPTEAALTAHIPFQSCPNCSRTGLSLKHWRQAWACDCRKCGARLLPVLARPEDAPAPEKLLRRAHRGAKLLEQAVRSDRTRSQRRAMRATTFAMALRAVRGDPLHALQSPRPEVRLFCLAAIAAAQSRPLLKAAILSTGIGDFAYVTLLRAYEKESRLLAAVDRIAVRRRRRTFLSEAKSHN